MTEGMLSAADVAAVTRNNENCNDMWGGGGWWIWIILIAFLFPMMGGWNRGGVETGVHDNFISDEFVKRDIFNTNQNVSMPDPERCAGEPVRKPAWIAADTGSTAELLLRYPERDPAESVRFRTNGTDNAGTDGAVLL